MAFFDELKDRAMDLGRAGVAKSKQLAEITKLSLSNAGEEDAIRKAYMEIGKLYYAERGMAAEPAYVALCERITAAKINIEENKNRIAELKREGNISDDGPPAMWRPTCPLRSRWAAMRRPLRNKQKKRPLRRSGLFYLALLALSVDVKK